MNRLKPRGNGIAAQLARRGSIVPATDASQFWNNFRARLPLYPQHPPVKRGMAAHPGPWTWTLGSLGATSLLAVAAWFIFLQPQPLQADFAIHSYEITPEHGSVMIWQEEASKATILWISGLELPAEASQQETTP